MTQFNKPAHTLDQHIQLLRQRGLHIPDEGRARHHLANISYYRFSAYTRVFYQPGLGEHRFLPGTDFDAVLDLYTFDRELRLLLLDAIERIEVALRAQLTNTLAEHHGPHGYLAPCLFDTRYNHRGLISRLNTRAKLHHAETFLVHYHSKYTAAPPQPPVWMAMERLTFGQVAMLFSSLRQPQDTQRLEGHFGWRHALLCTWFRGLSDLRNHCAHQNRVWNREFGSQPEMPRRRLRPWPEIPNAIPLPETPEAIPVPEIPSATPVEGKARPQRSIDPRRRIYAQLAVIESLLQVVCPGSGWAGRLAQLLRRYPAPSRPSMGFPPGWERDPFWQAALSAGGWWRRVAWKCRK